MNPDHDLERRAAARADVLRIAAQPECRCAFHRGIAVLARQNNIEENQRLDLKRN